MFTLYIDMDDVLAETGQGIVNVVNADFDRNVTFEDIYTFDLKTAFQMTEAEWTRLFSLIHAPEVLAGFACLPGAADALSRIRAAGAEIAIVTGRPAATEAVSREWLMRHHIPFDSLSMVDKYGREPDPHRALSMEALSRRHFDLAIEDSPAMATHLSQSMQVPVLLMDRPWNRGMDTHNGVRRIQGWTEAESAILKAFDSKVCTRRR